MKKELLLVLFPFFTICIQAQTFTFSAGVEYHHLPNFIYNSTKIGFVPIPDTQTDTSIVVQTVENTIRNEVEYYSSSGIQAQLDASWKIRKSFEIATGVGSRFSQFTANNFFSSTLITEVIRKDTIIRNLEPDTTGIGCVQNNSLIIGDYPTFRSIEFNIPLKLIFSTWEDDIKIGIGGVIAIPIDVSTNQLIETETEELINGQFHCNTTYHIESVSARHLFRKLNFGGNVFFEYWPFKRWGLMLTMEQRFRDIFNGDELDIGLNNNPSLNHRNSAKPTYLGVSIKYRIKQ